MILIPCRKIEAHSKARRQINDKYNDIIKANPWTISTSQAAFLRLLLRVNYVDHSKIQVDPVTALLYLSENKKDYYTGPFHDACYACIVEGIVSLYTQEASDRLLITEFLQRLKCYIAPKRGYSRDCICHICVVIRFLRLFKNRYDIKNFVKYVCDSIED